MRKPATSVLTVSLACFLWSGDIWAQQPAAQPNQPKNDPAKSESQTEAATTITTKVNLVNVYVTVTDATGAPVGGLKKENFLLEEDGHQQKIAIFDRESALPLSIALAVDTSLSTRHDLPLEQASAKRFAHAILRPVDAISIFSFSE